MKRSVLFMLALTLIGSSALAQGLPSAGPHVSGLNPPYAGATSSAPTGIAAYGTSSGVHGTQFPYGTATTAFPNGTGSAQGMLDFYGTAAAVAPYAASPYAKASGVHDTQDFYGTGAATSRFGTSPVMGSPQATFGTAQQYNPHPYGVVPR